MVLTEDAPQGDTILEQFSRAWVWIDEPGVRKIALTAFEGGITYEITAYKVGEVFRFDILARDAE